MNICPKHLESMNVRKQNIDASGDTHTADYFVKVTVNFIIKYDSTSKKNNKPLARSQKKKRESQLETNFEESTNLTTDRTELIEAKKLSKKNKGKVETSEDDEDDRKLTNKGGNQETALVAENVLKKSKEGLQENKSKKSVKKKRKEAIKEEKVEDVFVDDGHVMQVIIHRSDRLKFNMLMSHPVVSVSLIDANTGDYIKKTDKKRSVISRYENRNNRVDYIQPVLTLPFDFKNNQSITPVWEDSIIINEAFNHFVRPEAKVILFFQLMDFVEAKYVNSNPLFQQGWFTIAWAFLQLVGSDGSSNWGRKARLQLYKVPNFIYPKKSHQPEVFHWWSSESRTAYPSTLYVTINKVKIISEVTPSLRSLCPLQEEMGLQNLVDKSQSSLVLSPSDQPSNSADHLIVWSRLPGQSCQIPRSLEKSLPSATKGCSYVKFSKDGRLLACGCHEVDCFPLIIYEVPSFHHSVTYKGHQGIIYDICWTKDDKHVLSSSADGTVRIWSIETRDVKASAFHPSFLYAAQIEPIGNKIIVTGGYDKLIRIWSLTFSNNQDKTSESCSTRQLQELNLHANYINVISFHPNGTVFYSGDANGSVMMWILDVENNPTAPASFKKEIKIDGTKGAPITSLDVHPFGHRLLVQSQNNKLQVFDLRVEGTLHKLLGPVNIRLKLKSCFSSDGSLVFSGSEDGKVYVWSTESGNQLSIYKSLNYNAAVCCLDTHPFDDYVAFCCHEHYQPIKIYKYDPSDPANQNLPREGWKELNAMVSSSETKNDILSMAKSSIVDFDFMHSMRIQSIKSKLSEVSSMHQGSTYSFQSNFRESRSQVTPRPSAQPVLTISAQNDQEVKVVFRPSSMAPVKEIVIATEDYSAQRSDELTFSRGDTIVVLHKDFNSWWMGYMPATTKQGFFPATLVVPRNKSSLSSDQSVRGLEKLTLKDSKIDEGEEMKSKAKYGSLLREKKSRSGLRRNSGSVRVSFNLNEDSVQNKSRSKEIVADDSQSPLIVSSTSMVRRGSRNFQNLNPIPEDKPLNLQKSENPQLNDTSNSQIQGTDRSALDTNIDVANKKPPLPSPSSSMRKNSLTPQRALHAS